MKCFIKILALTLAAAMLLTACGGSKDKKETNTDDENINQANKVTIANPHKYSAWPFIGLSEDKLVCIYTVADQHDATASSLYMKSSLDGLNWSDGIEIFKDKTGVKGITGIGYDNDGNMLLWYRNGSPAVETSTFELFKIDGDNITLVSSPNLDVKGGHIGNIVRTPNNELWAFYNTYADFRSWGYVKSADNGLTWEQVEVEKDIYKAACPAELECAFISDDKILVLGRKDVADASVSMFQIESSDYGKTWDKKYTNIMDAYASSPSVIFDRETGKICLYYFSRDLGELRQRIVNIEDVWNNPQNWNKATVLTSESASGVDTGNVKTVLYNGSHICTYYAGNSTTTGVYGVVLDMQ